MIKPSGDSPSNSCSVFWVIEGWSEVFCSIMDWYYDVCQIGPAEYISNCSLFCILEGWKEFAQTIGDWHMLIYCPDNMLNLVRSNLFANLDNRPFSDRTKT